MGGRVQPAILGGLFIGILSTLPIVNIGNMCCCLWVISGGVLSVWLLQQDSPDPLTGADGALMGLLFVASAGSLLDEVRARPQGQCREPRGLAFVR